MTKIGREMKKLLINISTIAAFVCGIGLLSYPFIANYYSNLISSKAISEYEEKISNFPDEKLEKEIELVTIYDDNLVGEPLHDPFTLGAGHVLPENYLEILNVNGDGIMGSIIIPKINVNLPIYHGVGEESLQRGAGHIEYTSTPYGGRGRHSFISAHRGLPNALMFTDLNQLEEGDMFFINVLGEKHAYEVTEIDIIKPEEFNSTAPDPEKDRVTLITCTPYGVNTERLLVTGDRVLNYTEEKINDAVSSTSAGYFEILYISIFAVALIIFAYSVFRFVYKNGLRKRRAL